MRLAVLEYVRGQKAQADCRVCEDCAHVLPGENAFVMQHLPVLMDGGYYCLRGRSGMSGMGSLSIALGGQEEVYCRLDRSHAALLLVPDQGASSLSGRRIPLSSITDLKLLSKPENGIIQYSVSFEGAFERESSRRLALQSPQRVQIQALYSALSEAVRIWKGESIEEKENRRRLELENTKFVERRRQALAERSAANEALRSKIAAKYNLTRRGTD